MGRVVATTLGIKGTDANGDVFGVLYTDIDRFVPSAHGCKMYLHSGGYMIRLHQSYDEMQSMMAAALKELRAAKK